jgi:hypothetical protein
MPYKRKFFSSDSNMAMAVMDISSNDKATVIVQLAAGKDMSAIVVFACELIDYEKLAHICEVTDVKLLELSL